MITITCTFCNETFEADTDKVSCPNCGRFHKVRLDRNQNKPYFKPWDQHTLALELLHIKGSGLVPVKPRSL